MPSEIFKLNKDDGKKILNGLIIAILGVVLTYLEQTISKVDFGAYSPIVAALNSVLVNSARKWLSDNEGKVLGKYKI